MEWRYLKVLFVGEGPSSRNKDLGIPFVGTNSYKRLLKWIGELDLDVEAVRLTNSDRTHSYYLTKNEFDAIIFLGKKSVRPVIEDMNRPKVITIDHPSPKNRNLNDPEYEKKMLKELKRWLYE